MAIQVNGTTVINDSRALQNIASLDATTTATISAAGGGGGLELLQNTAITSDTSYIDYNFPSGYSEFFFVFDQFRSTFSAAYNYPRMQIRLKDGSGNLITGYEYYRGTMQSLNDNLDNKIDYCMRLGTQNSPNRAQSAYMRINVPKRSDVRTQITSYATGNWMDGTAEERDQSNFVAVPLYAEANNGIRFFNYSGSFDSTSNRYLIFGVPDA